ncbi:hypothetical protein PRIPAC_76364 [Pristionchus pacificus]|uniref:Uncharacterized protein n=1 Tax=Pristionchus pacificus TaxID=54126 RepID=A0A2A6B523_PRIPA|nr:hypothetical protein PRIPAC_76364 [Pristionchus pacificus]|eukprot:PDM60953.1 hypothetical protein PRIPAC_54759 [Pristionchus pacificus]
MDAICNEEVWWREEELAVGSANVKGLKEKADHIERCIDAFLAGRPNLPLGLVAEWSQRGSYARRKVIEASGECLSESKRRIKTADERRAQTDGRRIVRDECARCALPFGRSETRRRALWRLEVRGRQDEKEEGEEGDQRLIAVCEGCEQSHMVGRMPRLQGEKRKRREEEEDEGAETEWDTKSIVSIGGASTSASSVFGSEKKRKGSLSSLCSTPSSHPASSSISAASPLVVSAAAKKSAKKKRGSELSRLLRESETKGKKEEEEGGLAAFLASLS